MHSTTLSFESTYLWFPISILIGIIYAAILYYNYKGPWSKAKQSLFFILRSVVVASIVLLLADAFLKYKDTEVQSPIVAISIDNSLSVSKAIDTEDLKQLKTQVSSMKQSLEDQGVSVVLTDVNGQSIERIPEKFEEETSDISNGLKKIIADYSDRGLSGIALISDGIYNAGSSPEYNLFSYPIYTLGLGDTIPKSDILIADIYYNKVSYQGNKFPILVNINSVGFENSGTAVSLYHKGELVERKPIVFTQSQQHTQVEFSVLASSSGLQSYTIEVEKLDGEFQYDNNRRKIFVEVVEGREHIMVLADAPHPDIKAIKSALEQNSNYQVDIHYTHFNTTLSKTLPDLVILYQMPSKNTGFPSEWKPYVDGRFPILYMLGTQTNLKAWNNMNGVFKLGTQAFDYDYVTPKVAITFDGFTIDYADKERIESWIPVQVPYGNYAILGQVENLLLQRINNLNLNKPLISFSKTEKNRKGYFFGQGIWKWRLQEFAEKNNHDSFDRLIQKTVQYLSSKADKKQFKVYPLKAKFTDTEKVIFNAEIYNEVFEPLNGQEVLLNLTSEKDGKKSTKPFTFSPSEGNSEFSLGALKEGVYGYTASTEINKTKFISKGQFIVEKVDIELRDLTADHRVLRNVSLKSGGVFKNSSAFQSWKASIMNKDRKGKLIVHQKWQPIINIKWLFFILIAFISTEWFMRKYNGEV